ncbi:MAG: cell wall hydrolase [Pseudomonadota bacterium]
MTARDYHAISYHSIPEINWNLRSLMAAVGIASCLLLTAMSTTASARRAEAAKIAQDAIANEATLLAEFADYLAAETSTTRTSLQQPRLKPMVETADVVLQDAPVEDLVNFNFDVIDMAALDAEEHRCLAQAIYYEARSESRVGQAAVADVVLNRVATSVYPNTICGVVFQGSHRKTGCQFSFTCDGSMKARLNTRKWIASEKLAGAILSGMRLPVSREATHYHANYVNPYWAKKLTPTATIGTHKFYRFPSKKVRAAAPAATVEM